MSLIRTQGEAARAADVAGQKRRFAIVVGLSVAVAVGGVVAFAFDDVVIGVAVGALLYAVTIRLVRFSR